MNDFFDESLEDVRRLGHLAEQAGPANASAHAMIARKARAGDAAWQYKLGLRFNLGIGTAVDDERAQELFRKAAEQGHTEACYALGHLLNLEPGPEGSPEAMSWYRRAAAGGHAKAHFELGAHVIMDERKCSDKAQLAEGQGHLLAAAEAGDLMAMEVLAHSYRIGIDGRFTDPAAAVHWYERMYKIGKWMPDSLINLPDLLVAGKGVEKNYARAITIYRDIVDRGTSNFTDQAAIIVTHALARGEAMYALGMVSELGLGVPKDMNEAAQWYLQAVVTSVGPGKAQPSLRLGLCCLRGHVPERMVKVESSEHAAAAGLFRTAFDEATPEKCQEELANIDVAGLPSCFGVKRDLRDTRARAAYELALLHSAGSGVESKTTSERRSCFSSRRRRGFTAR